MKVWLVGTCDVEMTNVEHVCLSEKTALKRWEEIRLSLVDGCQRHIDNMNEKKDTLGLASYEREIIRLSETDPKKLDNYPHDEPFITEMETEE
jgi:hypothetical protein